MIHPVPWSLPEGMRAYFTCRESLAGVPDSAAPWQLFNMGDHVGDAPAAVAAHRAALLQHCEGLAGVQWLNQVHGVEVHDLQQLGDPIEADAAICQTPGLATAVMTADCLPVLICDARGEQWAAAHAGWRGLCDGVIAETVKRFSCHARELLVWLGPAISRRHFEVGAEVRSAFIDQFDAPKTAIETAFLPSKRSSGRYMADLHALASAQLQALGVEHISRSAACTYADASRFYSYRRDGDTGRFACFIYRTA